MFETKAVIFTEKEKLLLNLLCQDMTTSEIATKMGLSPRTVEKIRDNCREKADITHVHALVYYAVKNGIVPLFPD